MLSALFLAAASPASSCPFENARYVLRADPTVTAVFHAVERTRDWHSGVAMELRLGRTGRTSWWLPFHGGTSDHNGLRWTARRGTPQAEPGYAYNLGDLQYFGFDAGYAMPLDVPTRGEPAADHFLLNDLRDVFWYRDDSAARSSPPRSLFDFAGCAARPADAIRSDIVFPPVP
jgi:hypothetical protein